jgi:hypothetical protein
VGQVGPLLDHGGGRPDLDNDGGHACFSQYRDRHSHDAAVGDPKGRWNLGLHQFGQASSSRRFVAVAGIERGHTARRLGIEAETQIGVDLGCVGPLGLGGVIGMVQLGHLSSRRDELAPESSHRGAETTGLAHGDMAPGQGGRGPSKMLTSAHGRDQLRRIVTVLQAKEFHQGLSADDAVHRLSGVSLKVGQGGRGQVAKDAVDLTRIKAQGAQSLLDFGHVVASKHRRAAVEEAVTQAKSRLNQDVPGLATNHAVHAQSPTMLEGLHRGPSGRTERTVRRHGPDQGAQTMLDIEHGIASVALRQRQYGARGPSRVSRCIRRGGRGRGVRARRLYR